MILFISHEASRTGAPLLLLAFLRWLRQNTSLQFRVLLSSNGPLAKEFEAIAEVDYFDPPRSLVRKALRKLNMERGYVQRHRRLLQESLSRANVTLIYANTVANGNILKFLSFLDCPVISHTHELEGSIQLLGPDNFSLVQRYTSRFVAVSLAVKQNLVKRHSIPEDKVILAHGFIPTSDKLEQVIEDSRRIRAKIGVPQHSKLILGCGSIEARKGTDIFLKVAERVLSRCHDWPIHFVWVGGLPTQLRDVQCQVSMSSLQAKVHFVGQKNSVAPYYAASDLFLLTSREDPFPLVMLEAALHSLPIVAFDNGGGAPEFVEDDAGQIVPGFDVETTAESVIHLLRSPQLRKKLGNCAREKVLMHHSVDVGAAKILDVIESELRGIAVGSCIPAVHVS